MTELSVRATGLGKRYRLREARGAGRTLREALVEGATGAARSVRALGSPAARRSRDPVDGTFWALRDVSFDVRPGEVVGIVGRNGSGKSTLLKILSRITEPTAGSAELHGRVGSLLEVGTGFHPELTGRENIFLSGAILGMRRAEIERGFDEIVDFAEIEQFLDTPVKRYSSGMYMRLAFAVAAHLEPEILVVDEVLAVGDAAFQRKCLGKMGTVARHGRTVLFVSHNMGAVVSLCSRCLLLADGALVRDGEAAKVAAEYQSRLHSAVGDTSDLSGAEHYGTGKARFTSLRVTPRAADGEPREFLRTGDDLDVDLRIAGISRVENANVCVVLYDATGYRLVDVSTALRGQFLTLDAGEQARVHFRLTTLLLKPGTYLLGLWIGRGAVENVDGILYAATVEVEADPDRLRHSETFPGPYQCDFTHSLEVGAAALPLGARPAPLWSAGV